MRDLCGYASRELNLWGQHKVSSGVCIAKGSPEPRRFSGLVSLIRPYTKPHLAHFVSPMRIREAELDPMVPWHGLGTQNPYKPTTVQGPIAQIP